MTFEKKRRIFVAIGISQELQDDILEWEKSYSNLPVRWLLGKNLHITLVPPWYAEDIESVIKKLETVKDTGAFDIEFNRVIYGPEPRRPRLIWAEGRVPEKMVSLKNELEKILAQESEKRPFKLHLTIARFRPEQFSSFPVKELNEKVFWKDKVDSFVLMESHLSRSGADYEVLTEIKL